MVSGMLASKACASGYVPRLLAGTVPDVSSVLGRPIHPPRTYCSTTWGAVWPTVARISKRVRTEWRTPPLWGLGLTNDVNGREELTHDRCP